MSCWQEDSQHMSGQIAALHLCKPCYGRNRHAEPMAAHGSSSLAPQWLSNATRVLARTGSGPGGEACFDEDADRNLMALLAVSSLCSAGQPFSHQFDMHGILLSSKDAWS